MVPQILEEYHQAHNQRQLDIDLSWHPQAERQDEDTKEHKTDATKQNEQV